MGGNTCRGVEGGQTTQVEHSEASISESVTTKQQIDHKVEGGYTTEQGMSITSYYHRAPHTIPQGNSHKKLTLIMAY